MNDCKLVYDNGFDIVIDKHFNPIYIKETTDQRAAVACAIARGTVPANPLLGVDFSALYQPDERNAMMAIYDDAKKMIKRCAGNSTDPAGQYLPMFSKADGKYTIRVVRGTK